MKAFITTPEGKELFEEMTTQKTVFLSPLCPASATKSFLPLLDAMYKKALLIQTKLDLSMYS